MKRTLPPLNGLRAFEAAARDVVGDALIKTDLPALTGT